MNKLFLLSISFIFLFSCNKPLEKPEHLISKSKFKNILLDLYLSKHLNGLTDTNKIDYAQVNAALFQKYNVTPQQYEKSLQYYMISSDVYEKILQEISDSLKFNENKDTKIDELISPN